MYWIYFCLFFNEDKIKYQANITNFEYKDKLEKEFKSRVLHNQHEVNSITSTITNFLSTKRDDDLVDEKMKKIINTLAKINTNFPATEYDGEMEKMKDSKWLKLDFLKKLKDRDMIKETETGRLMNEQDNIKYRELCDPDLGKDYFHDHNIR